MHAPDPLAPSPFIEGLAARIAPSYRVMSISPRRDTPYQVSAMDLYGVLRQFGFEDAVLVGEGLGCLAALVLSAWYPERVRRLILFAPKWEASGDSLEARALRECPPDINALREDLRCHVCTAGSAEEIAATLP